MKTNVSDQYTVGDLILHRQNCIKCGKFHIRESPDDSLICNFCNTNNIIISTKVWQFRYRAYKKQRAIQLKPIDDNTNHFSLIWTKKKNEFTKDQFNEVDEGIRKYISDHNNTLTFRIIRPCKNCTYGRFDDEFEELILSYRKKFSLFTGKDLTLDDPKHQDLYDVELWNKDYPIIHHIHSKGIPEWNTFMLGPRNSLLTLQIELLDTE